MNSNEELLSLVVKIYDAALDEAQWQGVLTCIAECAGGQGAGLVSFRPSGEIEVAHSVGVDAQFVQSYVDSFEALDPSRNIRYAQVGRVYSTEHWVAVDEFRSSEFYQEWARPQDLEDGANALLEKSDEIISHISIMKAGQMVDDRMRKVLSTLMPHLRRSMLIGKTLRRQNVIEATATELLDALKTAVILLDAKANIVHANASGLEVLAETDVLRSVHGQLFATRPETNRALRQALTALAPGSAETVQGMSFPLSAADGVHFVGHLVPLTAGRRRQLATAYEACAMLFVNKAALDTTLAPDIIQKVFKLTPAELRVLLAIVELGGAPEVAKNLGVAISTVKTHLNSIFAKTDTRRQAELVRLMAAFAPPMAR